MKLSDAVKKTGISAIIYGESGMGKTHFLGTLPGKTLIIAAEANGIKCLLRSENKDNIDVRYLPNFEAEMDKFFGDLMIEDLPFDNICLDSATELDKYLMLEKTDPNKNDGIPQQRTYRVVQFAMRRYLRILRDLTVMRGKNVIITAIEQALELNINGEQQIAKSYPAISTKKFPPEACGLVDIVGHIEILADGKRFLRFEANDQVAAKDRIFPRKGCYAQGDLLLSGKTGKEAEENKIQKEGK